MIELARPNGSYRLLFAGDVAQIGLADGSYGLAVASIVDEHLRDLKPLYREAARVIRLGRPVR